MWIKGLDGTDNKIINLLLEDGRMSYSEIGNIVGLSRTSVKSRISELEEKGIISACFITTSRNRYFLIFR